MCGREEGGCRKEEEGKHDTHSFEVKQRKIPTVKAPAATCFKRPWMQSCARLKEVRQVPVVSLKTVLGWLGPRRTVNFTKIDIQGMDYNKRSSEKQAGGPKWMISGLSVFM